MEPGEERPKYRWKTVSFDLFPSFSSLSLSNPRNRIKSATAILKFCFERETWQCLLSPKSFRNNMKEILLRSYEGSSRGKGVGTKKDRGLLIRCFERGDGEKKEKKKKEKRVTDATNAIIENYEPRSM